MLVKGEYSIKSINPKLLFSPAMIAAFVAALMVAFGIHTPAMIARPMTMVGNITVPASLMIIGSSMARLSLREIVGSPKVYVASVLRLSVVPLSVYFLFKICGVSDVINNINTVVIAMPVASFGTEIRSQSIFDDRDDLHYHCSLHSEHSISNALIQISVIDLMSVVMCFESC